MDSYAAKGIKVSCRTINGKAFIFDQNTRFLLQLDEIGSFIWDQIDGTRTIEQIAEICCQTFAGDKEDIDLAVLEFIYDLHNKNVAAFSTKPFEGVMISAC